MHLSGRQALPLGSGWGLRTTSRPRPLARRTQACGPPPSSGCNHWAPRPRPEGPAPLRPRPPAADSAPRPARVIPGRARAPAAIFSPGSAKNSARRRCCAAPPCAPRVSRAIHSRCARARPGTARPLQPPAGGRADTRAAPSAREPLRAEASPGPPAQPARLLPSGSPGRARPRREGACLRVGGRARPSQVTRARRTRRRRVSAESPVRQLHSRAPLICSQASSQTTTHWSHCCPGRMPSTGCLLAATLFCCVSGTKPAAPSERPAGVVPFQEVWSRSYCRARETLVDVLSEFPHEAEHIFKPPCVPLWRCGGCCGDESLECVAVETRPIDLQVVRVSPILGTTRQEALTFTEHTRCACRPRRKRLKSERSHHRIGAKRRPREPSPTPSTPSCKPRSLGRPGAPPGGQEEVAVKLVPGAGRAAPPSCCHPWRGPCEMLGLEG
ncbi:vascular endothelial growth factor A, long form-like [Tiliqua scincoides]|uniref:vascular endothelial growth factor A, long form-like n=1 Tax=Tiliqua scincoides TaxID=71010 RepID=UPI003462EBA7